MTQRAYDLVRKVVERLGGSMVYEREGIQYGAWVLKLSDREVRIAAEGNRAFAELDRLYLPKIINPKTWDDYQNLLVPGVEMKILGLFGLGDLPAEDTAQIEAAIARSEWKFAWTYARTWPHEYTTKAKSTPSDHALLIGSIERFGVRIPWGKTQNCYLFFQGRKYWHMGNPHSEDPKEQPNIINRVWLDVRQHRQNVAHVWTKEEVELQERLWEIQAEKRSGS